MRTWEPNYWSSVLTPVLIQNYHFLHCKPFGIPKYALAFDIILCIVLWIAWWRLFRVETCRCGCNLLINMCVSLSYTFYIIYKTHRDDYGQRVPSCSVRTDGETDRYDKSLFAILLIRLKMNTSLKTWGTQWSVFLTQYCASNQIKKNEMNGHVARMWERRGVCRVLVGKPEENRPLGRLRHRWEDNIMMDLQEVGCGVMDWIEVAQDRDGWRALVNALMNLRVP